MRLYSPADLTGNVIMIEKLVLGGTGTGDLPIRVANSIKKIYWQIFKISKIFTDKRIFLLTYFM